MSESELWIKHLAPLGLKPSALADYAAPKQEEAAPESLTPLIETETGKVLLATRTTCKQWLKLQAAAEAADISVIPISAYRSVAYQATLIANKLAKGEQLTDILQSVALPGYSEHHTGEALDLATPGQAVLTEAFEQSAAFAWLSQHAADFGFYLSYPRNNSAGFVYEPWHWRYNPCL